MTSDPIMTSCRAIILHYRSVRIRFSIIGVPAVLFMSSCASLAQQMALLLRVRHGTCYCGLQNIMCCRLTIRNLYPTCRAEPACKHRRLARKRGWRQLSHCHR